MPCTLRRTARAAAVAALLVATCARAAIAERQERRQGDALTNDPVIARVHEHSVDSVARLVIVADRERFPPVVWKRVKNLVAFRLHRPRPDGTTVVDAPIYLVRDSDLYFKAAAALRNQTTNHEYLWCLLAAVIAHESAHTGPKTERQALITEAAQLRRCIVAGHLYSEGGWNPLAYLQKVEAKLRHPREHY